MRRAIPLALLFLVGCTAPAPDTPSTPPESTPVSIAPSPSPSPEPVARLAWETEVDLIGEPVVTDEVIVSYIDTGSGLVLAGFDPKTGEVLWRRSAATSGQATGVPLNASVIEHGGRIWAAAVAMDADGQHRVVVLDAATGQQVTLRHESLWATSRPWRCADDDPAFCFDAVYSSSEDREIMAFRVDPDKGTVEVDSDRNTGLNTRFLGARVYSTNDRPADGGEEILGYVQDGKTLWSHPYETVFGPGSSSDGGWSWSDRDDHPVVVGQGYVDVPREEPVVGDSFPAVDGVTVGLQRTTGEIAWRIEASEACPMEFDPTPEGSDAFIACLLSGGEYVVEADPDGGLRTQPVDIVADMVGIDRTSGEILWRHPLSGDDYVHADFFAQKESDLAIRGRDGATREVDLLTGEAVEVAPDEELACLSDRGYISLPWGDRIGEYSRGHGRLPCDRTGKELVEWAPESLSWGGRRAGDLVIVAGMTTLSAYYVSG